MTMFQASVMTFDCLDQVHVAVQVREMTEHGEANPTVLQVTTTVQGTGETDPRDWIRDALVAALEAL